MESLGLAGHSVDLVDPAGGVGRIGALKECDRKDADLTIVSSGVAERCSAPAGFGEARRHGCRPVTVCTWRRLAREDASTETDHAV